MNSEPHVLVIDGTSDTEAVLKAVLEPRGTQVELNLSVPEYDAEGHARTVPKTIKARIPRGATDGQRLRLRGQGGKGINGGRDGDL